MSKFKHGDWVSLVVNGDATFTTSKNIALLGRGPHKVFYADRDNTVGIKITFNTNHPNHHYQSCLWFRESEVEFAKEHYLNQFYEEVQ